MPCNKHPRDVAIMQDTVRLDLKHSLDMVWGIVTACNHSVELDERVCFSFSLCMFKKSQVMRHC